MHIQEVEKLQIAIEQLEDALEAYFTGRFHSAIVLAGASEQLLAGYLLKYGQTPSWVQTRNVVTRIANALRDESDEEPTTEKKMGDLLNRAYNNSKHAGTSDHTVLMDPHFEANAVIDRAITNLDALEAQGVAGLREMPLAQRFMTESAASTNLGEPDAG
jgi:hypothetical protein